MAGCFDWRVGSKARGTRSQFRLNTEGLLPFKCTYPVHLTDVMDAVPSTQSDLRRANLVSPVRGTRTRAVREYEQAIDELKKENFDLKLRIFLLEETINKTLPKNKGSGSEDQDNVVQVIVELKVETEALRNELSNKNQLLQEALDQAQKYETDLKELQEKFVQQQEQLSALTELPSAQEVRLIQDERETLLQENEELSSQLSEKDANLQEANTQLEELSNKNKALESKVKKSSLAIQGIVHKYYKDIEMIPKEIRPIVQSAVQAAKENNEEDLVVALKNFKTSVTELLSTSSDGATNLEFDVRNTKKSQDSMEEFQKSMGISKSFEELGQSSGKSHSKSKLAHDTKELTANTSLERSHLSAQSSESLNGSDKPCNSGSREDLEQMVDILRENEILKSENQEKSQVIGEQNTTINELEQRMIQLQSQLLDAVSKVKCLEMKLREERSKCTSSLPKMNSAVQTAVQWHLMQSEMSDKLLQNAGLSNNIDDLKEEILTLLLIIEQKDKEMADLEESLQQQMERVENRQNDSLPNMDIDYLTERNELHQRLADCTTVNNDLLKHLRSLEAFMENLLHHKSMDSSLDSVSQASDFLSQLTSCLDQTLKLSNVLSDHLSVCEGSRLFDPSDLTLMKEFNPEEKSCYPLSDHSQMSANTSINQSIAQGRDNFQSSERDMLKNTSGTGKRRLPFSKSSKSGIGSENVVVLGTSNNEDLILLLNDRGDPEDVLIRNNHSHLDKSTPYIDNGDQLRRRCWDQWSTENPTFSQNMNSWYSSQLNKMGPWHNPCPSSDSDIWSEPDRDISLQRIGIDVQKSPVTQKSPRRSRLRGRSTDEPSSQKNESSSSVAKLHPWSKRRRCSDTSKTSFICKKCMSQSQQTDDVTRQEKDEILRELDDLTEKCSVQQNQLKELHDLLRNKINMITYLNEEKQKLLNCIDPLKEELSALKDENKLLGEENSDFSIKLTQVNDENTGLRETVRGMEVKLSIYDTECEDLRVALSQTKSNLSILDSKCSDYSVKLTEVNGENIALRKTVGNMEGKLSHYDSECEQLKTELGQTKSKLAILDSKCSEYSVKLTEVNDENFSLKKTMGDMEVKLSCYDTECEELTTTLGEMKSKLHSLDTKCSEYQEQLSASSEDKEKCLKQLNELKSSKQELVIEVKGLISEKNELLQRIQIEKEAKEHLEKEKQELIIVLKDSSNLVSSLQSSYKILEEKNASCLREKEVAENSLLLSNSVCNDLKEELKEVYKLVDNLKLKCSTYRKELNDVSAFKQEISDKLSSFVAEFVSNLNNLKRICNQCLNLEGEAVKDNDNLTFELLSDKDEQTRKQLEAIVSANIILEEKLNLLSETLLKTSSSKKELSQNINSALQQLKMKEGDLEQLAAQNHILKSKIDECNQKLENYKFSNDQYKSKIESYQQQLNLNKSETKSLNVHYLELQNHIKELQQNVLDRERSLETFKVKEISLQKQVAVLQNQIENDQQQLNLKDDEITHLQERIFNLQTQINGLLTEKVSSTRQLKQSTSETLSKDIGCGSKEILNISSASQTSSRSDAESDRAGDDTSTSSVTSAKDAESERKASERYARKIKGLRTKLDISEKRVEILEKEKSDLRDEMMALIEGGKRASKLSGDIEALQKELTDVKGKLEAKTSFIRDLKKELQNSYNLLIETQKEVDELSQEKRSLEAKTEAAVQEPAKKSFSDPLQRNTESNISDLKKQKWDLVQDIFKQQKHFYERKNIHLGHFDKFCNHIEKLRSLQVSPSLHKSESEPTLNAPSTANSCYVEKCDRTLKNLQIELELDVECLQNFKIFLKRFFIPFIMQSCRCSKDDPKNDDSSTGVKGTVNSERKNLSLQTKSVSADKLVKNESLKTDFQKSVSMEALHSCSFSSSDRLLNAASVISHTVDSLDNILRSIKSEFQNVSEIESLPEETPRKSAAKSLLVKLFKELSTMQEKSDQISQLNSILKTLDLFHNDFPKSPTKQDMSDRESLISEDTITLSRSGSLSPMSFEEHFPTKLVSAKSTLQQEPENPKSDEDKATSLKISQKSNPAGGSQESICQRSHFSSPDLGIESDPNHESSAPEQTEFRDSSSRKWYISPKGKQWSMEKLTPLSMYSHNSNASKLLDDSSRMTASDSLHAIGMLQHYQLLKKEVQESLVGIKVVLSRTDDGLHHVAKYTSPRKGIECTTFKAIRDESLNIEMCLQEAAKLVDGFWIAPCPSVEELKTLIQQNQDLQSKLECLQEAKRRQQSCFEQAMDKLKNAEVLRENMEKNISKKLVKTKKVIRKVETKMLHSKNQALPPLPKFPGETSCQKEQ